MSDTSLGSETTSAWYNQLLNDKRFWYMPAFDGFPAIIAHEYRRVYDLCQQDKPYGMLFQIKDLFEVVLKFEVLAVCAWSDARQLTDFREKVTSQITTPNLSLGSWESFAIEIRDFFGLKKNPEHSPLPGEMARALMTILNTYQHNNIVHWRNDQIGHGALGFAEDQAFMEDVQDKLSVLQKLFEALKHDMTAHELLAGDQLLIGWAAARNLPTDCSLMLRVGGEVFPLSPYISEQDGGLFFFDNQKKNTLSQLQCYPSGQRREKAIAHFRELNILRVNTVDQSIAVDNNFFTDAEEDMINRSALRETFVKPSHLTDWLIGCVQTHDKGVFLLKMCRGMGKSTFAEKLNRYYEHPLRVDDDMDVRTYHIQRAQLVNSDDFERTVELLWAMHYVGRGAQWTRYRRISEYMEDGATPAEALAAFLNDCLRFTKRARLRGQSKIMLVIDGLDEIVDEALWAYLPSAELLDEGVYLLLTSRDAAWETELPPGFVKQLERLSVDALLTVTPDSASNRAFLSQYLHSAGLKGYTFAQEAAIFQQADYRVLNLGMLCALLRSGMNPDPALPAEQLLDSYLRLLEELYGPKEARRLRELLSILCIFSAKEPLTLKEIALLSGDSAVTLSLLGKINDLSVLLKVSRGYMAGGRHYVGNNRYAIANPGLTARLRCLLPELPEISSVLLQGAVIEAEEAVQDARVKTLQRMENRRMNHSDFYPFSMGAIRSEDGVLLTIFANLDGLTDEHGESYAVSRPAAFIEHIDVILEYIRMSSKHNMLSTRRSLDALDILKPILDDNAEQYRFALVHYYAMIGSMRDSVSKKRRNMMDRELFRYQLETRPITRELVYPWSWTIDAVRPKDDMAFLRLCGEIMRIEKRADQTPALRDRRTLLSTLTYMLYRIYRILKNRNSIGFTSTQRDECVRNLLSELDTLRSISAEIDDMFDYSSMCGSYADLGNCLRLLNAGDASVTVLEEGLDYCDTVYKRTVASTDLESKEAVRDLSRVEHSLLELRLTLWMALICAGRKEEADRCMDEAKRCLALQFTHDISFFFRHSFYFDRFEKEAPENTADDFRAGRAAFETYFANLSDRHAEAIRPEIARILMTTGEPPRKEALDRLNELTRDLILIKRPLDEPLIARIEALAKYTKFPERLYCELADLYTISGFNRRAIECLMKYLSYLEKRNAAGEEQRLSVLISTYQEIARLSDDEQEKAFYLAKAEKLQREIDEQEGRE